MYLEDELFNEIIFNIKLIKYNDVVMFDYFEDGIYFNGSFKKTKTGKDELKLNISVFGEAYKLKKEQEEIVRCKMYSESNTYDLGEFSLN